MQIGNGAAPKNFFIALLQMLIAIVLLIKNMIHKQKVFALYDVFFQG
ncbi:MAG: hypothetical protein RR645_07895 [Clostridium sp.]